MKKQIYKIDENGYMLFGEEIKIEVQEEVPLGYVDVPLPTDNNGEQFPFYAPKWTGTEWVEDITQEEIDELNNQPKEPTELGIQQEVINTLGQELALLKLQFMMGGM